MSPLDGIDNLESPDRPNVLQGDKRQPTRTNSGQSGPTSDRNSDGSVETQSPPDDQQDRPVITQTLEEKKKAADNGERMRLDTWKKLQRQQGEFERRTAQLEILRQRLQKHVNKSIVPLRAPTNDRGGPNRQSGGPLAKANSKGSAVDEIAVEYQESIDTLLDERYAIELRMADLQRQVAAVLPQADELHSQHKPAVGRRFLQWRFGVSSLLALIACGAVLSSTTFTYRVSAVLSSDSAKLTPEQLQEHQLRLTHALASQLLQSGSPISYAGPTPVTQSGPRRLTIDVTAVDAQVGMEKLKQFAQGYLAHIEQERVDSITAVGDEVRQIEIDLAGAQQAHGQMVRRQADERLHIQSSNPKEDLERLRQRIQETDIEFESAQSAIRQREDRLETLHRTVIPDFPEVDGAARAEANKSDRYLRTDLEALRVRLNRLREHLLEVFVVSEDVIRKYVAASNELRAYVEGAMLSVDNSEARSSLESVTTEADKLNAAILEFEQRWQQQHRILQQMTVDPRKRDCLQLQRKLEELVRNFHFDANEILKELQLEYQRFSQNDASAQHFALRGDFVDRAQNMIQHQQAFANLSRRVLPTSDFLMNDLLHSIVGLTRRVQNRQAAIETELSLARRNELAEDRKSKIENEQAMLDGLLKHRDRAFAQLLSLQHQLDALLPYIAEHGATTEVVRYDEDDVKRAQAGIDGLVQKRQVRLEELASLEQAGPPFRIEQSYASAWPANMFERLASVGFATGATMGICLVLFTVLTRLLGSAVVSPRKLQSP